MPATSTISDAPTDCRLRHEDRLPVRMVRALDAISLSLVAAAVLFCHPRLGATLLGDLGNLYLVPLALVGVATFSLLAPSSATPKWRSSLVRLRVAAVSAMGLLPFVSWWVRASESAYFLVAGSIGLYAGIWYLIELALLLHEVVTCAGARRLRLETMIARALVTYGLLVPVLAVHVSFATALVAFPGTVLSDLRRTWELVPPIVHCFMLTPVLLIAWLLWRAGNLVADRRSGMPATVHAGVPWQMAAPTADGSGLTSAEAPATAGSGGAQTDA